MRAARLGPALAAAAAAALVAVAASCRSAPAAPRTPGGPCTLAIALKGLRPEPGSGPVVVAVWSSPESFMRPGKAAGTRRVPPERASEAILVEGLPEGTYAVSAYHDRTSAGELRRGGFGVPLDPWAVSGGAAPFASPSWKRSAFEARPGRNEVVLDFVPGAGR